MGHFFKHLVEFLSAVIFAAGMLFQFLSAKVVRRIRKGRAK